MNLQQVENELIFFSFFFVWKSTHHVLELFQTGQIREMQYILILVYQFFSALKQVAVLP